MKTLNVEQSVVVKETIRRIVDNKLSSIRIAENVKVVLYDGANYQGANVELSADEPNLASKNFNDKTSSIFSVFKLMDLT